MRKYDDSEPRDDHGMWTAGGGGGGAAADPAERASASLKDSAFVQEHMGRLMAAGDEARAAFPAEERAGDVAHGAAQTAIHTEAMRIHTERDAAAGPDSAKLQQAGDNSHRWNEGSTADKHAAAMSSIERDKTALAEARADAANIKQSIEAGHVSEDIPHAAEDHFQAESERIAAEHDAITKTLDDAHSAAADAVARLNAVETESPNDDVDWSGKVDKVGGLDEEFAATQNELVGHSAETSYDRSEQHDHVEFPEAPERSSPDPEDKPEAPEKPDPPEHDPEATPEENAAAHAEYQDALANYNEEHAAYQEELAGHEQAIAEHAAYDKALAAHESEFKSRAAAAQTALEVLHDHQIAAAEKLPRLEQEHATALAAAVKEVDDLEPDALVNQSAVAHDPEAKGRAEQASESLIAGERSARADERSLDLEDARSALKDEMRSTVAAIKQLAKLTGRPARIPEKAPKPGKTKKSANRPGTDAQASVVGMAPRYKLKLTKLDFVSLVDTPAQETATVRCIKRGGVEEVEAKAVMRLAKIDAGDRPLAHFWAFTCTDENGQPYHDLQGDAISPDDFIKAAEEFLHSGAAVDEMHDGKQTTHVAFAYPMNSDVAHGMFGDVIGKLLKTSGLMVAIRPTPDQLAKLRDGTYTGVSIAGTGTREPIGKSADSATTCQGCKAPMGKDDAKCAGCGMAAYGKGKVGKGTWTTADIDSLPDSSFLYVEPGGKRDAAGKTTPRSLRHFPYRDAAGKVDIDHLRDAIGRIPQSSLDKTLRDKLQVKAESKLAAQHSKRFSKSTATLTSETDGHVHSIDLDDPADPWRDTLSTSYQTAAGATASHQHAWTYDPTTGAVTIAMDSDHDHTVDAVVPADVLARAAENDADPKCPGCGAECDDGDRFCPSCGARMDGDAVPSAVTDEKSSGATVVAISLRAPAGKSPLPVRASTVKSTTQEKPLMDPKFAKMLATALLLPEAQRAHVAKLAAEEPAALQAFLALDAASREDATNAALAADPVVYTTKSGGQVRKSHGELAKSQAEQIDRQAEQIAAQEAVLAVAKARTEQAELEKRAVEIIPLIGKSLGARVAILKGVNSITDEALRNEAIEALKGANAAFVLLGKAQGTDGGGTEAGGTDPKSIFNAELNAFAKSVNKTAAAATGDFIRTERGSDLYAEAYPRTQA